MGSARFRNPQALSSALASLGTLQPRAFGFLNRVDPLVSASNLYIVQLKVWAVVCYISVAIVLQVLVFN